MRTAERLRALRDAVGDTTLLALVRVGLGLLLVNEAWLATQQLRHPGFFGDYFHQPFLPESLVPSEGVFEAILVAQWAAAILVVAGRAARPALLASAAVLVYTMLCDRLWFHNYRHTMAAFATLLAFAPCDRRMVLGRPPVAAPGPLWAQHAMKAQVSVMYFASAGSKLFDPEWRGGQMMRGMVRAFARLMEHRGVPAELLHALQTPLGTSLLAKGAIATELSLAVLLWWPRTRRLAMWVGVFFHLSISLMTPVQLFTAMMLLVYVLFATPDAGAGVLRYGPDAQGLANVVEGLDWLRRFTLEKQEKRGIVVVARGGAELRGRRAVAEVCAALPVPFLVWPLAALLAALPSRKDE